MKKIWIVIVLVLAMAGSGWGASFILETSQRTALANNFNDDIGGGTIKIYTTSYATLLCTLTIPAANLNNVTSGVITLASIDPVAAVATGTAAVFRLYDSGSNLLATGDVNTSGATINLSTTSINSGQLVSPTSITFTIPAGS